MFACLREEEVQVVKTVLGTEDVGVYYRKDTCLGEDKMGNVVIVSEVQSYLILSLKSWFEQAEYEVTMVKADINAINKIEETPAVMLLYVDENMLEELQALNFIKDKAAEGDIPLFVVGDLDELNSVEKIISKNLIRQRFQRPINVNEVVATISNYERKHGRQNKKKILVVDDSGTMLRNVKGWLEETYQVSLANSAAMAIKAMSTNRPDLVLLDYEMPIVDGKQVLEMIRSEHDFADIPVIFLTSREDQETRDGAMALKPEGYLLKSMEPTEIVKAIDDFFGGLRRKELAGL